MHMSFAIRWWSLLVYLLAKIAFFAPGRTSWPGMHCVYVPLPLCSHSVCLCKGCCSCCSRQWLQGPHPRSVPRTAIGVIWSIFFFFFYFVIFKFPSSGVQGSLPSSALCCRAVGRRSLHGRLPATRASRQEKPVSCTASTHTHGHSNCSSQLITLQPACLSCFLFH